MIHQGNCLNVLKTLDSESVDCCVTSPPYWGLRDYGTTDQLGLESTPEEYVANMVSVFREVKRVLKNDGTCWLNLGDSYAGNCSRTSTGRQGMGDEREGIYTKTGNGLKSKDLVGIPWRVAFALQADGWYLRQDIIWHKPNPMPESVTDRCTKSHEYIFLLTKSAKYHYDHEAIKEPCINTAQQQQAKRNKKLHKGQSDPGGKRETTGGFTNTKIYDKRNKRSVWTVTTKPFSDAHFATFPMDLIEPCIKTTRPDAMILDPFSGAGTTGVVAKILNRNFVGIELNPEYVKMAENRIINTAVQEKLWSNI